MSLEKKIIEQGAPTLARLKTANLFTVQFENEAALLAELKRWNEFFQSKGVVLTLLKKQQHVALVYLYRKEMLQADLTQEGAVSLLQQFGYESLNMEQCVQRLSVRLSTLQEFPHEIGLFLGYPLEDVHGFICHKGQNCHLCGYWKVYGDTTYALVQFAKFDKCRLIYKKLWQEGRALEKLTVAS